MNSIIDKISNLPYEQSDKIKTVLLLLLQGRTWRYLRYLHAREVILLTENIKSVLVIGVGHGLAELALAIEFPEINFVLTDYDGASHSTNKTKYLIREWNIQNVVFDVVDILNPSFDKKFDMVYSVEVLEHIQNDKLASENMIKLSNRYVFCLVPFSEDELNSSKERRDYVFQKHGHYVCGYNPIMLKELFPNPILVRGCYWSNFGFLFRQKITNMTTEEIDTNMIELMKEAQNDLSDDIPINQKQAQGIIWLSII